MKSRCHRDTAHGKLTHRDPVAAMVDANRVRVKSIENLKKNGAQVELVNKSAFSYLAKGAGMYQSFLLPEKMRSSNRTTSRGKGCKLDGSVEHMKIEDGDYNTFDQRKSKAATGKYKLKRNSLSGNFSSPEGAVACLSSRNDVQQSPGEYGNYERENLAESTQKSASSFYMDTKSKLGTINLLKKQLKQGRNDFYELRTAK